MKITRFRCFAYWAGIVLLALLTIVVTACSSSKTTTTFTGTPVLTSIAVTPAPPPSLSKGHTQQFKAVGTYSNGTTADVTSLVAWVSDNTAAATIDNSGLATGVEAGIVHITASLDGVTSATQTLVVVSYY
jgi:Bacterial Ig-like domain (group 2)